MLTKATGFSMVEVMIALLVVMIGAMAAAGMQSVALVSSQQSAYQTIATQLATELADKIRMYSRVSKKGQSEGLSQFLEINYSAHSNLVPSFSAPVCYGNSRECSADEMARFEIENIQRRVAEALPGGRVQVCHDNAPWDSATASYRWSCAGEKEADTAIVIKLGWNGKQDDLKAPSHGNAEAPPKLVVNVSAHAG